MMDQNIQYKLDRLHDCSSPVRISGRDRLVVFSDLHMGDGRFGDDFRRTAAQFSSVLENYYLERGFKLILNGDVEDLFKYTMNKILESWRRIYELLKRFLTGSSMYKLTGNHDWNISEYADYYLDLDHLYTLKMKLGDATLFFLHGHQASPYIERTENFSQTVHRKFVKPFGIPNTSLKINKMNIRPLERRLSDFSVRRGVLTFMGHTHKPHFGYFSSLPGVFNSGCSSGKRGISALEIERGRISLVHWIDSRLVKLYGNIRDPLKTMVKGTGSYRITLDSGGIDNIVRSLKLHAA
jgi:predicted phosphodiesterase